jgi:hypothetical protein
LGSKTLGAMPVLCRSAGRQPARFSPGVGVGGASASSSAAIPGFSFPASGGASPSRSACSSASTAAQSWASRSGGKVSASGSVSATSPVKKVAGVVPFFSAISCGQGKGSAASEVVAPGASWGAFPGGEHLGQRRGHLRAWPRPSGAGPGPHCLICLCGEESPHYDTVTFSWRVAHGTSRRCSVL